MSHQVAMISPLQRRAVLVHSSQEQAHDVYRMVDVVIQIIFVDYFV